MGMQLLLAASITDPTVIVPISMAVFIGGLIFLVYSMMGGAGKMDERLGRLAQRGGGGGGDTRVTGTERFQQLLEKAAPKIADNLIPQNEEQQDVLKARLGMAGWRGENAAAKYTIVQLVATLTGLGLALGLLLPQYGMTTDFMLYGTGVAGIFFYLPQMFVAWRISVRQDQIFMGLPDALDLMVVCVEAGLGLDAAMRKVCEEMGRTQPIISEEFSICNFQLQMGRPRREVLHDLGQRTGVDDMKSLAAILIQADRFGASIAQALRVQSDSMRVRRRQLAEERAAKTAVQLIFPLVLFIFPAIFIVLVGPAAIQIMEALSSL